VDGAKHIPSSVGEMILFAITRQKIVDVRNCVIQKICDWHAVLPVARAELLGALGVRFGERP
jgi:hypothetical protein